MELPDPEPRWPGFVAMIATGALHYALPPQLVVGPSWLVFVLVVAMTLATATLHFMGRHESAQMMGYAALGIMTFAMAASLTLLVYRLPLHLESPAQLLRSASALWVSNLLVFASWYWRLDAGGPHRRDLVSSHTDGAFLFPQMTLDKDLRREMGEDQWRPGFVDYLFLAFNTSTAFSPTDVPVLSRWAKLLMMVQAGISLATLAVLAARAVNIL